MKRKTDEVISIMIKSLETSIEKNNAIHSNIAQVNHCVNKLIATLPVASGAEKIKDEIISKLGQVNRMFEALKNGEFRKVYAVASLKRILTQLNAYKERHNIK